MTFNRPHGLQLFVLLLSVLLSGWYWQAARSISIKVGGDWYPTFSIDDVYITLRYAKHLATGQGLVWNLSDPPLEGFSSFAWTILITPFYWVSDSPLYYLLGLCALLHVLSLWFLLPILQGLGEIFRLSYFGDLLPNTYYLKMVGRPGRLDWGIQYVYGYLVSFAGGLLILPLSLFALMNRQWRWLRPLGIGLPLTFLHVAYVGGHGIPNWRFLINSMAMFLVLLSAWAAHQWERGDTVLRWFGPALMASLVCFSLPALHREYSINRGWFPKPVSFMADLIKTGLSLREHCAPQTLIAVFPAGALPYFSELPAIDMLGRADRHIASLPAYEAHLLPGHDKFDFEYVIDRHPDLIFSWTSNQLLHDPRQVAQLKKYRSQRFLVRSLAEAEAVAGVPAQRQTLAGDWTGGGFYSSRIDCLWHRRARLAPARS